MEAEADEVGCRGGYISVSQYPGGCRGGPKSAPGRDMMCLMRLVYSHRHSHLTFTAKFTLYYTVLLAMIQHVECTQKGVKQTFTLTIYRADPAIFESSSPRHHVGS